MDMKPPPPRRTGPSPHVLKPAPPPEPKPTPTVDAEEFLREPVKVVKSGSSLAGKIELLVFALLLVVLFIFGLQNLQNVTVKFFIYQTTFPLGVAMLLAAAVGGALMALIWAAWAIKRKLRDS